MITGPNCLLLGSDGIFISSRIELYLMKIIFIRFKGLVVLCLDEKYNKIN